MTNSVQVYVDSMGETHTLPSPLQQIHITVHGMPDKRFNESIRAYEWISAIENKAKEELPAQV